jgi:hypothetical protein
LRSVTSTRSSPRTSDLARLLADRGPSLTTELIEHMVANGASQAAARQRITRGLAADGFQITRLAGIRFQHNARFVYLRDQFGDLKFWRALERAFRRSGQSYWRAVVGLRARGGRIPRRLFAVASGAPAARTGHTSPARILERLRAIQLLTIEEDSEGEEWVTFLPYAYRSDTAPQVRARLLAEMVALEGVKEWVRRLSFGSYEQVRLRGGETEPEVAGVAWDLSAPSYIRPLVSVSGATAKPGFVVADILLREVVEPDAVEAFVGKYDIAAAPARVGPILAFLVADGFSAPAFGAAKAKGIIPATTEMLLGDDIARALRELVEVLTNLGATVAVNPGVLDRVLSTLTKIQGAAANVRSSLFELAVGYLAKEIEGGYMTAGAKVRHPLTFETADIDVLVDRPDQAPVLVIECKAKMPGSRVSLSDVQRWRGNRLPLISDAMQDNARFAGRVIDFQLWTNGDFHPAALAWLETQPPAYSLHTIGWKDGAALKAYAGLAKSEVISKIMNEHYFRDALTTALRTPSQPAPAGSERGRP